MVSSILLFDIFLVSCLNHPSAFSVLFRSGINHIILLLIPCWFSLFFLFTDCWISSFFIFLSSALGIIHSPQMVLPQLSANLNPLEQSPHSKQLINFLVASAKFSLSFYRLMMLPQIWSVIHSFLFFVLFCPCFFWKQAWLVFVFVCFFIRMLVLLLSVTIMDAAGFAVSMLHFLSSSWFSLFNPSLPAFCCACF